MLIHIHKVSIAGKSASGGIVINTDFLSQLRVNGTGSEFLFFEQPEDRRSRSPLWVVEETVAEIRTLMNLPLAVNVTALDYFPEFDTTKATQRTYALLSEIVKVYPWGGNRNYSVVLVNAKGFGLDRYLVDNYYLDFQTISETGSSSTTTSTTSTSSTSSTSSTTT